MLLSIFFSFSQENKKSDSIPIVPVQLLKANYKDFMVINQNVYAITSGDSLVVFNFKNNQIQMVIPNMKAIAKTSGNAIFYVNCKMQLYITTDFKDSKLIDSIRGNLPRILVDKSDNYVVVTSDGIFFKENFYVPETELQRRGYLSNRNLKSDLIRYPNLIYLDQKEKIWLTYDNGEFGNNIYFFDLKSKVFLEPDYLYLMAKNKKAKYFGTDQYKKDLLDSFPDHIKKVKNQLVYKFPNNLPIYHGVKGIAENKEGDILISQSLMHFSVQGCLGLYTASEIKNFYYSDRIRNVLEYSSKFKENDSLAILQEYLGPTCYNPFDHSFYYYSDKGFFKILKTKDVYSKELFFKPLITWTFGMSHSVGYEMNVKKFEFISSNELIFLTSNNGIGYFDGKVVKYFK